jgi:hypothetical protein
VEKTEVYQQFTDKAVQRREAANRNGPNHEEGRRPGDVTQQPAHTIYFACSCRVDNRSCPKKKECLEGGVIQHMKERTAKGECRQKWRPCCRTYESHTDLMAMMPMFSIL